MLRCIEQQFSSVSTMGWWFFPNRNDDHTVLAKYLSGGPYGLGDPNDKSLRKVEKEILIPKLMRDRTKAVSYCRSIQESAGILQLVLLYFHISYN